MINFLACRILTLFCFVQLLGSSGSFAQSTELAFKHLTINEGLSQNTAFSIFQDSKGFIWIGTEDGLNRYDGYEFKIFKNEPGNPKSLINNQVNAIAEDANHQLIVGTAGGISIFDPKTENFINFSIPAKEKDAQATNFITAVIPYKRGQIWISTFGGLKLFDSRKVALLSHPLVKATSGVKVQTVYRDKQNILWVSHNNTIKCFDQSTGRPIDPPSVLIDAFDRNPGDVRVIKQDPNGNMWFGTEQSGLFFYNPTANICINYRHNPADPASLPVNVVRDVFFNDDGKVWVATRKGLSVLDLSTQHYKTYTHDKYNPESLSHRSVLRIMRDRAGSIWVGTFAGGVNLYTPVSLNFTKIGEQLGDLKGINNPVVSAIAHEPDGGLWIGTEGGGLNFLNRSRNQFTFYSLKKSAADVSENLIKSLSRDEKGNIWVGAFDGLYYFDVSAKAFTRFSLNQDKRFSGRNQVYAVLADGKGVWAGTNGGGLLYFESGKIVKAYTADKTKPSTISGNHISALLKDPKGNLWVGTLQGISYLDVRKDRFTRFLYNAANPNGLNNNNINCLYLDSKQRLWIGTRGGGLNVYHPQLKRFASITEKDGLANNVIRAINEDRSGNIWVSSNKGISFVKLQNAAGNGLPQFEYVKNYSIIDGLQSNQFLSGSTDRLNNGELLFGGINGVTTFIPERLKTNRNIPNTVFTDFLVNNRSVVIGAEDSPLEQHINEARNITLAYEQGNITIKFAALNFINSSKNRYAYKLEGFSNDEWHDVGDQRSATYTNLNAGKYVFLVKASNNDGIWNEKPARIHIRILPPWYKTWWAYLIYIGIISSLLYFFYYFSYKTIRLKNELDFEQMSHEKDQELAQRKLTFFTHISHEIKTPLTLILSPIEKLLSTNTLDNKVQNQLQLIQRNGERLMRITNQLLDYRKFDTGNMKLQAAEGNIVRFLREVIAAFQSYAQSKEIDLKLISTQKSIRVWFDRDKMEKVMFNLISNALKFTPKGGHIHVILEVDIQGNHLNIVVEDNGFGISAENIKSIFNQFQHFNTNGENQQGTGLGLSFSKGLVELHHGNINVVSTPAQNEQGGSTCFTVTLPLGKEHLTEEEIIQDYSNSEDITAYNNIEVAAIADKIAEKKSSVLGIMEQEKLVMLIVEDNEEVLNFIQSHFHDDFEVHLASEGQMGWDIATSIIPDIVISDVMMPKLMGTELCSKLKSDIRTSHIPVILLTAREPLLFKIEGLETGADDYITKPFNLRYLEMRVWNLLELRVRLREKYGKRFNMQPANLAITSPDEKFLEKAMKYIEENISEPTLSVEELSKVVGMSKTTLYRKIKALTNQNTNEFIRSVRLNIAAQLLKQRKFNVSEVAYNVGFSNHDYFRKCFKEQFGTTPKEYAAGS